MNVLEMFLGTSGGLDAVINIAVYAVIVLLFIVGVIRCIAPISRTRATIRRAKIRNVVFGTLLFQGIMAIGVAVANQLMPSTSLSEIIRMILCNGIILYALAQSQGGGKKRG